MPSKEGRSGKSCLANLLLEEEPRFRVEVSKVWSRGSRACGQRFRVREETFRFGVLSSACATCSVYLRNKSLFLKTNN